MQESVTSLRQSWVIQYRVIKALFLREVLTRFGRHNFGFLWMFGEPMIFTLAIVALWTALKAVHSSSLPIVAFAVTGYSSVLLWRNMPMRCVKAIEPNAALMFHRHVKVLDIYIARLVLEAAGATMSFIALSTFFVAIGMMRGPEDILKVMAAWLLLAWFGAALALTIGAFSETSDLVEKLWPPGSYVAFPLSGAAFIVDALPEPAQKAILWMPMVHGAEMLRDGFFGNQVRSHYDAGYLILWALGLTLFGLAKIRIISRNVIPE